MRQGATQQIPTANPRVVANIWAGEHQGGFYTSHGAGFGQERIVSVLADEQAWGGKYEILLDNSDNALNNVNDVGKRLYLDFSFVGEPLQMGSELSMPTLYILHSGWVSREGKLLMKLSCVDGLGLLSLSKTSFANWYFNQEWQRDENIDEYVLPSGDPIPADLRADLVANYGKTIYEMCSSIIGTIGVSLTPGAALSISRDSSLGKKIPISFSNALSGLRQLTEMTRSYPAWKYGEFFRLISTEQEVVSYHYNQANTFFISAYEQGAVVPNFITFWAFNEAGSDWIHGEARDEESIGLLGEIPRHYILTPELQVDGRSTEADLTEVAEGTLNKIKQERGQGYLVAPMHCAQELFDKIEVVDSRYTPSKTIEGVVHRIVREYDRGKYQITLYLGGVTSGVTHDEFGGNEAIPLHEADPPRAPIKVPEAIDTKHLYIVAAYSVPLASILCTPEISDPGEALLATSALDAPMPSVSSDTLQSTITAPSDVYIHDGVNLVDTDVTAENNDDLQTYQACPTDPSLGDGLYVCHTSKFDYIQFYINTAGVGTYAIRPSYYNGSAWVAVPSFYSDGDETDDFKVTGYRWVSFNRPSDWALFTVDGKSRYIIHMEIDFEGTMTTIPLIRTATLGVW